MIYGHFILLSTVHLAMRISNNFNKYLDVGRKDDKIKNDDSNNTNGDARVLIF